MRKIQREAAFNLPPPPTSAVYSEPLALPAGAGKTPDFSPRMAVSRKASPPRA